MLIVHRRPALVMAVLMVPAVTGLLGVVDPGYAAGGTNLLTNGGFEAGGGSLTGWSAVAGKLTTASDGDGGGHAALASVNGRSRPAVYGLTTASGPVTNAPARETFTAAARIRSATPGKSVCVVLRELSPGGAQVQTVQQCGATTASWVSLPTPTVTVRTPGDSISMTVQQVSGSRGDSFEADSLSLVDPDTSAPSVPAGASAAAPTSSEVDLSWNPSSDPDGAGVYGYVVSRDGAAIATLGASATSYSDATVSASSPYSYTVAAFDYAGNRSADSSAATVTTPSPPVDNPPSVPDGVVATAASSVEADVSWAASSDTDATGLSGYVIARNGTTVATVGAATTSYADTTVSPSTAYSYTVAAFDTAQNSSAPSSPATVTTPPGPSVSGTDDLWHLDELTGTTMVDAGLTPHPGLLHNMSLGQAGDPAFPGTSYGFNGTSSSVSIPNAADLNAGSQDIRIGLSLNTTTVPAVPDYDLFRKGQYPGTEYKLELQPNGQFSCEFRTLQADGVTVKGYTIQPAIDLHDGVWHRLTCTKVGGKMTVTIDGTAYTKTITGSISNSYDMIIGAYSNKGGGDFYQGRLDDISFHIG